MFQKMFVYLPPADDAGEFKDKVLAIILRKLKVYTQLVTETTAQYFLECDQLKIGSPNLMDNFLETRLRGIVDMDLKEHTIKTEISSKSQVKFTILKHEDIPHLVQIAQDIIAANKTSLRQLRVHHVPKDYKDSFGFFEVPPQGMFL